jgi:hypothetical protein
MITVRDMAFVWSRLALAALLAAGAACAPAEACPDGTGGDGANSPQLACCDGASIVLLDVANDCFDDAIVAEAPSVALAPRTAITMSTALAHTAPAVTRDVLVVAPKTSPPQT